MTKSSANGDECIFVLPQREKSKFPLTRSYFEA